MTNKEAFEKMVELCNFYHHTIVKDTDIEFVCDYRIDNIRKDLEVLEIIKKNPEIDVFKELTEAETFAFRNVFYNHW